VVEFLGTRAYDNPGVATVIDTGYIDARAYLDQFGITDPTTQDCTAAIQAAIDAGVAANKRIVLPPGRIYLAGTLSVNVTTYLGIIVIEGVGPRSTTLYAGVPGSDPRSVFMVAGTAAINPTFLLSNLCIDANGQRQSAFLVMGTYVFTSSLSNVVLTGSSTYGNLSVAYSASLLGCQFYNVSMEGGAYSIYADESSSLQACAFFGSRITGSSVCGIWGRNHDHGSPDIHFWGTKISGHAHSAMDFGGGHFVTVWGSRIGNNCISDSTNTVAETRVGGSILSDPSLVMSNSGTAPPVVQISGNRSAFANFDTVEVGIVTPGTLGNMVFRWRTITGGSPGPWASVSSLAAATTNYTLANTGYTLSLSAGSYSADNDYLFVQPTIAMNSGVVGNVDSAGFVVSVEVQITVSGGFGVGKFRYRVYFNGVAGAWSADTTIQQTVTFPVDGAGKGYGLVGTFENRTYQYTPGDLTQCTYQYVRNTTRAYCDFDGCIMMPRPVGRTSPRITVASTHTTFVANESTQWQPGDTCTGVDGTGTASSAIVASPVSAPVWSWPSSQRADISPEIAGTIQISDAGTTATQSLSYTQMDTNYWVMVRPMTVSGNPAAASYAPYVSAKTVNSFTITVPGAPGAGNSILYAWMLVRQTQLQ
jgi:hypothetical protein